MHLFAGRTPSSYTPCSLQHADERRIVIVGYSTSISFAQRDLLLSSATHSLFSFGRETRSAACYLLPAIQTQIPPTSSFPPHHPFPLPFLPPPTHPPTSIPRCRSLIPFPTPFPFLSFTFHNIRIQSTSHGLYTPASSASSSSHSHLPPIPIPPPTVFSKSSHALLNQSVH